MILTFIAAVAYMIAIKSKKIKGYMPVPLAEEEPQNTLELKDFGPH